MEEKQEAVVEPAVAKSKKAVTPVVTKENTPMQNWLNAFKDNYSGATEEAKEIEGFMKKSYKDDNYVPWATMERLTYQQDPEATFTNILNEYGGLVHTVRVGNYQKNVQKGEVISETDTTMYCHTVKVSLVFLGKEFIEDYPLQDQSYGAPKVFDQNMVNKSLKRALAKVASRGTGLGLKLYEGHDLQFETKEEPAVPNVVMPTPVEMSNISVPEIPKAPAKAKAVAVKEADIGTQMTIDEVSGSTVVKPFIIDDAETIAAKIDNIVAPITVAPTVEIPVVTVAPVASNVDVHVLETIKLFRETSPEDVNNTLRNINTSLIKKYAFALSLEDTDEELYAKISKFPDTEKFKNSMNNQLK